MAAATVLSSSVAPAGLRRGPSLPAAAPSIPSSRAPLDGRSRRCSLQSSSSSSLRRVLHASPPLNAVPAGATVRSTADGRWKRDVSSIKGERKRERKRLIESIPRFHAFFFRRPRQNLPSSSSTSSSKQKRNSSPTPTSSSSPTSEAPTPASSSRAWATATDPRRRTQPAQEGRRSSRSSTRRAATRRSPTRSRRSSASRRSSLPGPRRSRWRAPWRGTGAR